MAHRSMAGFARLTDEALGTVMAPFPWRKRTETGKGEGKGSRQGWRDSWGSENISTNHYF